MELENSFINFMQPCTPGQLREIVTKHGMPFSAVDSLVAGNYVKKDGKAFDAR